jgi:hypothetical protein
MKRTIFAALLLAASTLAAAVCYPHPETQVTYCTAAGECPAGTTWAPSTQACTYPLPTFGCPAGQVWSPYYRRCETLLPTCQYVIVYQKHDPAAAVMHRPLDYCPEIDVVLATLLAQLLTQPQP